MNAVQTTERLPFYDLLRGVALVAMTIYHFTWDLEFFGFLLPGTITEPGWVIFARSIATSFIFLAGFSLVLAHGDRIRWRGFAKREAQIIVSALAITIATFFAFPDSFIFFGILHAIALFSLMGLAFITLPFWVSGILVLAVMLVWMNFTDPFFSSPILWWIGLSPTPPVSNDYVPMFPWFAAMLAGISAGKLGRRLGWIAPIGRVAVPSVLQKPLTFIGRHSLVYYLLHQPVMLGLLWTFTALAGPADRTAEFMASCQAQCVQTREQAFCEIYCGCVGNGLKQENLFVPLYEGQVDIATNDIAQGIIQQCTADAANDPSN